MNLVLQREASLVTGIFSTLYTEDGKKICFTLEHSYPGPGLDGFVAKVPVGVYRCVRGDHVLHSGPIETFEVLKVPGHTGILFHKGNHESDSEGCILLGTGRIISDTEGVAGISGSQFAYTFFMDLMKDRNEFFLTVKPQ